jgi:hypothetical protein
MFDLFLKNKLNVADVKRVINPEQIIRLNLYDIKMLSRIFSPQLNYTIYVII